MLIPNNRIALGKLAQAVIYGAKVVAVEGNFDRALEIVRSITAKHPITLVNSVNPYRLEGQKTAAFEVCEQLGRVRTIWPFPSGTRATLPPIGKDSTNFMRRAESIPCPKMIGFEAEGAAAIVKGEPIREPETIATAIRIGNPASWQGASLAAKESGGMIHSVSDEEIVNAYRLLAQKEGIFAEPASAASVAGVIKLKKQGYFTGG